MNGETVIMPSPVVLPTEPVLANESTSDVLR